MVVLEDVDLIAMDRDISEGPNPLLFTLLDAIDGVGSDADVTFVLTTNRADILERALADRPGRVDLAIEIPRRTRRCRERLLRLYARGVAIDGSLSAVVAATEGVTASYIKELVRRAVLAALRAPARPLDASPGALRRRAGRDERRAPVAHPFPARRRGRSRRHAPGGRPAPPPPLANRYAAHRRCSAGGYRQELHRPP